MNNTNIWIQHINGSPGRHVSLLIKVVWLAALFSNSKLVFIQYFCQLADWPTSISQL